MRAWNWRKHGGALSHFSDRFLHERAEDIPWHDIEIPADPATRAGVIAAWVERTHDEYRSMAAFAELLDQLIQIASPLDVIGCASRVVRDETRHVELCARVVTALGGKAPTSGGPRWVASDKRRPARDRVASTMVGTMCIAESISVVMIARALARTEDPVIYEVTRRVLADEAFHSRFGFDWLNATWKTLPLSTRLFVESSLPTRIARLEQEQTGDRLKAFQTAMTKNIVPRLEAAGVHAHRAWTARSV